MSTDSSLASHYTQPDLLATLTNALDAAGVATQDCSIDELAPLDEFHVGGRVATESLCARLGLAAGMKVLDLGCGLGGPARFVASSFGAKVSGVDLTDSYVTVADALTARCGLGNSTEFVVGSALDLDDADASYDVATMFHVGMNIADKAALFEETYRVLRPGGRFGIYDIVRATDADVSYPTPWATDESMSWLGSVAEYTAAATLAGFETVEVVDRGQFARDLFVEQGRAVAAGEPRPALGLHFVLGPDAGLKLKNLAEAVMAGTLAPTEMVFAKPA